MQMDSKLAQKWSESSPNPAAGAPENGLWAVGFDAVLAWGVLRLFTSGRCGNPPGGGHRNLPRRQARMGLLQGRAHVCRGYTLALG